MDLDLGKRTIFRVKFEGKTYDVRKPSVKEVGLFNRKLKEAGNDEYSQLDATKAWVSSLGMPEEVIEQLEMEQFNTLLETVSGLKKN